MKCIDFDCGMAAALGVASTLYVLMNLSFDPVPPPLSRADIILIIIAVVSYMTAAVTRGLFASLEFVRRVPSWVFVALIGSALFTIPFYGYKVLWVSAEFEWAYALKLLLVFTSYSSLFAACAYYSGRVIRYIKKWHDGPDYRSSSILHN